MITIKFDKKLYKKSVIDEAVEVFKHLGDFNFAKTKTCFELKISKTPVDINHIIKDEFCNHVLFLMNK